MDDKKLKELLTELCRKAYWHGEDYGDYEMKDFIEIDETIKEIRDGNL